MRNLIIICTVYLFLVGCECGAKPETPRVEKTLSPIEKCEKSGGIPILYEDSFYQLKDCQFPPR